MDALENALGVRGWLADMEPQRGTSLPAPGMLQRLGGGSYAHTRDRLVLDSLHCSWDVMMEVEGEGRVMMELLLLLAVDDCSR